MKKKLLVLMLGLAMVFALAACGGGSGDAAPAGDDGSAAALEPLTVDKDAKSVTVLTHVNGTFFDQSTMHYVVFKDGGAGDKCMLPAECSAEDFYNAMLEIGGEPWNTTSDKIEDGAFTDGQKVDVTLTWEGQDSPVAMADSVKTDNGTFNVDMRFSGNMDNNTECGSGCISCLNSCWAGITSNAAYGFGAIDAGQPTCYLNDEVMPEDGTAVLVTFTLQ